MYTNIYATFLCQTFQRNLCYIKMYSHTTFPCFVLLRRSFLLSFLDLIFSEFVTSKFCPPNWVFVTQIIVGGFEILNFVRFLNFLNFLRAKRATHMDTAFVKSNNITRNSGFQEKSYPNDCIKFLIQIILKHISH